MKATTAQQALIHMLVSLGVSALLTIAGLVYQFVLGHGLDAPALLKFIGPVFLGQLSLIWLSLKSNPSLAQAELDTINEALQGLHDKIDGLLPFLHSHPVPALTPAPVVQLPFPAASSAAATPFSNTVTAQTAGIPASMVQPAGMISMPQIPVPQLAFPTGAGMVIPQAIQTTLNVPAVKP